MGKSKLETRAIRAQFTDESIRVYQAFSSSIAIPALQNQKLGDGFKMDRMTWIKPSFCWMLYRSNFASSLNQEHILAVDIKRSGLDWALANSVLSSHSPDVHSHTSWARLLKSAPVRVQWDPERNIKLERVEGVRAIQIGLSGVAVQRYVDDWVIRIHDVTNLAARARYGEVSDLQQLGIYERSYPLDPRLAEKVSAT